jgi:putative oxidoreductase
VPAHARKHCASIIQALGVPAFDLLAWVTIFIALFGGLAVLLDGFLPLVGMPMAIILLVATFTVRADPVHLNQATVR